jgi:pyruvate dehydrogenase E1 component beta subunit
MVVVEEGWPTCSISAEIIAIAMTEGFDDLDAPVLRVTDADVPQVEDYVLPIGKAKVVRPGKDVTLVSYSIGVGVALEAAQQLMAEGINAEVVDLRTLRPLDKATVLESLARTNRMVVVEEGWPTCSISAEIIAIAMTEGFDDLDAPVLRVTNEDVPLPYAANLEKMALIKAEDVVSAAKKVCYRD